jgi:Kef-type K+ transport system membrane component KefB
VVLLASLALIFARVFGYLFDKIKQPAVIGEILAGVFLGGLGIFVFNGDPILLLDFQIPFPNFDFTSSEFVFLAELGIFFLLFISGLETSLSSLKKMGKSSLFVAIGGIIFPFVLGVGTGVYFEFDPKISIIIGLILVATSVGVTVRTLLDIHTLHTDSGSTILGAAVIDDIIGIILLAFFLGTDPPIQIILKILIFFFIFLYMGLKLIDGILDLGEKIHLPKAFLSISLAIFLIYVFFADASGIAGIIGAFVAGLVIGRTLKSRKIIDDVHALGYGLFIPLFFVWVGANLWQGATSDLNSYINIAIFSTILIIIAIIGKIAGCGLGAKISGLSNLESIQVGIGMIPRMELALIIVTSTISKGIFNSEQISHQILSSTVILAVITTLITPILLKLVYKNG